MATEHRDPDGGRQWLPEQWRLGEMHLLTGPATLWFVAFLAVPLAIILYYSVLTYSTFNVVHELTLHAWSTTVFTQTTLAVFARTLVIGLVVTALCLVVGYPLAYFLRFYTTTVGGTLLLLFFVIPFWTSGVIRTIGWLPILGKTGVVNQLLIMVGVIDQPLSWLLYSPVSQILGYLQNYVVFMAAPIYISLSQVDAGLLDASETLRGDHLATFRHVTWPLSLPGVAIGSIFVFVLSIGNFTVPQFLSGGEATITTLIYLTVNNGLNYPAASALSIALLVVIFAVVFLLLRRVDISEIAQS
ncbi:ABC transporter permease (plasmid) [Halarchaeum sp. CBA1220]|uniref:ABC transporter permease n=1 Tax=Halarchaeum sp. CBA1220 TaxID=1853682 RepID=UPI000F3AA5EE|nr:ABC transporter permease [Halarchaeum sp. CBA1220]QLC35375.1 ABC transporter permease [Halarchaeum sp. CBA1220]